MSALEKLAEPLRIGNVILPNRVFMAPMSGVSDLPFRVRGVMHGAGLAVSEMVASGPLSHDRPESLRRMRRDQDGSVHSVQLAGRNPHWMAEAARIVEDSGADLVDINMGCPAKKVIGGYAGSALMREPDKALEIIDAVTSAVNIPVTLKMRLGWDEDTINAPLIAKRAVNSGVQMITIHGRTRCQFYKGKADWRAISAVKAAVDIPIVANGDVDNVGDALAILDKSKADAIMIGRGHYGRPWLAGEIARAAGTAIGVRQPETSKEIESYVREHYDAMLTLYGIERGCRHARKHLGWYMDRFAHDVSDTLRLAIMRSTSPSDVHAHLASVDWCKGRADINELAA